MNEAYIMRPGDTFVADECGCSFTVESGPNDEGMARQAPRCCCGHEMQKVGAMGGMELANRGVTGSAVTDNNPEQSENGAPHAMAD